MSTSKPSISSPIVVAQVEEAPTYEQNWERPPMWNAAMEDVLIAMVVVALVLGAVLWSGRSKKAE